MQDGSVLLFRRPPEQTETIKVPLFLVVMEDSAMKTSRCLSGSKNTKIVKGFRCLSLLLKWKTRYSVGHATEAECKHRIVIAAAFGYLAQRCYLYVPKAKQQNHIWKES